MRPQRLYLSGVGTCIVGMAVAAIPALAQPAATPPGMDQLPAACRADKANFRPVSKGDLEEAKRDLLAAVGRLQRRLQADGANGEDWRNFLLWKRMQEQLTHSEPDRAVLNRVYSKYVSGHEGLGLVWFVEVRQGLQRYLELGDAMADPEMPAKFAQRMDDLAGQLETYAAKPTPEQALAVGPVVGWLDHSRQAPGALKAIRQHLVRPNLLAHVSAEVAGAGITGPVDDTRPVRDYILGTDIHGTGRTTGYMASELLPFGESGVMDTVFAGRAFSQTVGFHGRVQIFSHSTAELRARKRLWVDAEGFKAHAGLSSACVSTTICDIQTARGRRLGERMAWRRALEQLSTAEWIAARHTEVRLSDQIDRQAGEMLVRVNQDFTQKFRRPLLRHKLFPQQLRFSTTQQAMHVLALQADDYQLAAPSEPPPLAQGADLGLRLHESLVNNAAASGLGGMLLRQQTFESGLKYMLGKEELPRRFQSDPDEDPWTIVFPQVQPAPPSRPISVTFGDGQIRIVVSGQHFYKGNEWQPGHDIMAVYKIEKTPEGGFVAARRGPLDIRRRPGSGGSTIRHITAQRLLEKRFNRIFEEEMLIENIELPGNWAKAGKLEPIQVEADRGWLVVGFRRAAAP